jgi:N-acetylglucosamine-6-phosphate deacetylase
VKIIKCGKLVTPDGIRNNKYLFINGDKITSINNNKTKDQEKNVLDLSDKIVGPGLIDMHCHGALNSDFADGDIDGVSNAAKYHLEKGTTTVLATIGSCMPDEMLRAIKTASELKKT